MLFFIECTQDGKTYIYRWYADDVESAAAQWGDSTQYVGGVRIWEAKEGNPSSFQLSPRWDVRPL